MSVSLLFAAISCYGLDIHPLESSHVINLAARASHQRKLTKEHALIFDIHFTIILKDDGSKVNTYLRPGLNVPFSCSPRVLCMPLPN